MPIEFQKPEAFLILILLLPVIFLLWWEFRKKLRVCRIIRRTPARILSGQAKKGLILALLFGFLAAALSKPTVLSDRVISPVKTPNQVILLFDVSQSMAAKGEHSEFSRLDRAKGIAINILPQISGDQIAVYAFTNRYVPLADFTDDISYIEKTIKDALQIEGIGGTGSIVGQPIFWLPEEKFDFGTPGEKIIILFSDGENTTEDDWIPQAPANARKFLVKVLAVGIGELEGADIVLSWKDWKQEEKKEIFRTYLDSAYLRSLAESTGGVYFSENEISKLRSYLKDLGPGRMFDKREEKIPQDISGLFIVGAILSLAVLWRYYR